MYIYVCIYTYDICVILMLSLWKLSLLESFVRLSSSMDVVVVLVASDLTTTLVNESNLH